MLNSLVGIVLDIAVLPRGNTAEDQLKNTKARLDKPTYDAPTTMVQSIMRYNQLFTIKSEIIIAGDFSLRAGDLIYCDFPELSTDKKSNTNKNKENATGGIYMIASLCHRITPRETYTSLTLVRDTFGRKPFN